MVGGDQWSAGQPRDDESGDHPALRVGPEKKSRRASERDPKKRAAWRERTRGIAPDRFVWVDETGSHLGMTRTHSRAPRGHRAYGDVPQRRGANRTLITALTTAGFGPGLLLDEPIDRTTFDGYIIHCLAPTLKPDQIVVVDTLKVHYSDRARAAIEARGAQLWSLPPYSPDLMPIEEAFSKVKTSLRTAGPRTVEAHSTATWAALRTVTPQDAAGWIAHAGYASPKRPTRAPRQRLIPGILFRFADPHPAFVLPLPTSTALDHL